MAKTWETKGAVRKYIQIACPTCHAPIGEPCYPFRQHPEEHERGACIARVGQTRKIRPEIKIGEINRLLKGISKPIKHRHSTYSAYCNAGTPASHDKCSGKRSRKHGLTLFCMCP